MAKTTKTPLMRVIADCRNAVRLPDGSPMPAGAKHALVTLATYHPTIRPSQQRLAADMCVDERSVRRRLDVLDKAGLISRNRGRQHWATFYELDLRSIRECGDGYEHESDSVPPSEEIDW